MIFDDFDLPLALIFEELIDIDKKSKEDEDEEETPKKTEQKKGERYK